MGEAEKETIHPKKRAIGQECFSFSGARRKIQTNREAGIHPLRFEKGKDEKHVGLGSNN